MLAVLRQLGFDKYIANENVPGVAKEGQLIEEIEAQRKCNARDTSTRTDLAMGDAGDGRDDPHQWRNDMRGEMREFLTSSWW